MESEIEILVRFTVGKLNREWLKDNGWYIYIYKAQFENYQFLQNQVALVIEIEDIAACYLICN